MDGEFETASDACENIDLSMEQFCDQISIPELHSCANLKEKDTRTYIPNASFTQCVPSAEKKSAGMSLMMCKTECIDKTQKCLANVPIICKDPQKYCNLYCQQECMAGYDKQNKNPYPNASYCTAICKEQCMDPKTCHAFVSSRCKSEFCPIPICASLCENHDKAVKIQFMNNGMPLLKKEDYLCVSGKNQECLDFDPIEKRWFYKIKENYDPSTMMVGDFGTLSPSPTTATAIPSSMPDFAITTMPPYEMMTTTGIPIPIATTYDPAKEYPDIPTTRPIPREHATLPVPSTTSAPFVPVATLSAPIVQTQAPPPPPPPQPPSRPPATTTFFQKNKMLILSIVIVGSLLIIILCYIIYRRLTTRPPPPSAAAVASTTVVPTPPPPQPSAAVASTIAVTPPTVAAVMPSPPLSFAPPRAIAMATPIIHKQRQQSRQQQQQRQLPSMRDADIDYGRINRKENAMIQKIYATPAIPPPSKNSRFKNLGFGPER